MATKEIGTADRNSDETALRDVWYARVLLEQGRPIPIKVDLSNSATARLIEPHARTKFLPGRLRSGPLRFEIRHSRKLRSQTAGAWQQSG